MSAFIDWWKTLPSRFIEWWLGLLANFLHFVRPLPPASPIAGMPLRYLLGAAYAPGEEGCVTMVPWREPKAPIGLSAGYCNAFDESESYDADTNTGRYGPYRKQTATSREYEEGVPDQDGEGYWKNISDQLDLRVQQGIRLVEIDNPDAYPLRNVLDAIDWAGVRGIQVLAKNPGLSNLWREDFLPVVAHPNVVGIICEHGAGDANGMHNMRCEAGKPDLPVRFVAYNDGEGGDTWAQSMANQIERNHYIDMGVTYSGSAREYATSRDVIRPNTWKT